MCVRFPCFCSQHCKTALFSALLFRRAVPSVVPYPHPSTLQSTCQFRRDVRICTSTLAGKTDAQQNENIDRESTRQPLPFPPPRRTGSTVHPLLPRCGSTLGGSASPRSSPMASGQPPAPTAKARAFKRLPNVAKSIALRGRAPLVVGRRRVRGLIAPFSGFIRSAPSRPWASLISDLQAPSCFGDPPLLSARRVPSSAPSSLVDAVPMSLPSPPLVIGWWEKIWVAWSIAQTGGCPGTNGWNRDSAGEGGLVRPLAGFWQGGISVFFRPTFLFEKSPDACFQCGTDAASSSPAEGSALFVVCRFLGKRPLLGARRCLVCFGPAPGCIASRWIPLSRPICLKMALYFTWSRTNLGRVTKDGRTMCRTRSSLLRGTWKGRRFREKGRGAPKMRKLMILSYIVKGRTRRCFLSLFNTRERDAPSRNYSAIGHTATKTRFQHPSPSYFRTRDFNSDERIPFVESSSRLVVCKLQSAGAPSLLSLIDAAVVSNFGFGTWSPRGCPDFETMQPSTYFKDETSHQRKNLSEHALSSTYSCIV